MSRHTASCAVGCALHAPGWAVIWARRRAASTRRTTLRQRAREKQVGRGGVGRHTASADQNAARSRGRGSAQLRARGRHASCRLGLRARRGRGASGRSGGSETGRSNGCRSFRHAPHHTSRRSRARWSSLRSRALRQRVACHVCTCVCAPPSVFRTAPSPPRRGPDSHTAPRFRRLLSAIGCDSRVSGADSATQTRLQRNTVDV